MAKLVSNVRGTDRISVFWNDDTSYRQKLCDGGDGVRRRIVVVFNASTSPIKE